MLSHWVKPVKKTLIDVANQMPEGYLGKQVLFYAGNEIKLPKGGIVLIGINEVEADAVRLQLFKFVSPGKHTTLVDIGNFRKDESDFCIPLIQELLTVGHIVVLIGKGEDTAITQFLSYRDFKRVSNFAVIDQHLKLTLKESGNAIFSPLQQILYPQHKRLFHFCLIASQSHLVNQDVHHFLEKKNFDLIRLGTLRSDMASVEPAIRDMDLISVNLRALKTIFPDIIESDSTSGLTVEESCQICRYAGLSEKVSSISFTGFNDTKNRLGLQANTAAQMVWYFCEGVAQRHGDFPVSTVQMTEYIIDLQKHGYQLTFWRSNKSGRWWVQVPVQIEKNKERHRLVPCTYQDYQKATTEELSDRLVKAFVRFT
jgi:formiminoglutamase